ncbi:MAG: hypothetical protein K0S34_1569, partial [Bacillales bacterium]|nr:hypothetical protein [Bacillales bacterium]
MKKILIICITILVVMINLPKEVNAKSYKDAKFVKTKAQIKNFKVLTAAASLDKNGDPILYTSLHGVPAKVALVNLKNMESVKELPLLNSKYNWAIDFDSKNVAYFGGTPDGHLYSYDNTKGTLKDLGKILIGNDTAIYGLKVVGTEVYAVTANGGSLYSYNLMTRKTTYY